MVGERVGGAADAARTSVSALPGLPAEAVASLRAAFAGEVADRLPRLAAAAAGQVDSADSEDFAVVLRDAHTLGSSAAVVGAVEASRTARELEELLIAEDLTAVPAMAARLVEQLAAWTS